MLEKPSELELYRPVKEGGRIGCLNVELKAFACVLVTFLQTAANNRFHRVPHPPEGSPSVSTWSPPPLYEL